MALKQIKTKRRVVLTGYPLQNNLLEYWCMVDFVRPSYLGTRIEFSNMFERPIQNGQCIDSTPQDCKLMRYRAHVLHSLLKGFVQRRSHTVLQKCLPQKVEYVLLVRLTPFQRKLYNVFMDEVVRSKKVPNPLKAFSVCCKIWNHPDVLHHFLKKRERDLELELEEAENERIRKRNKKLNGKDGQSNENNPIRLSAPKSLPQPPSSNAFKPPVTPSSNDSAYSSNQSLSSGYETATGYNSYTNYYDSNPYQNYSNYCNTNGSYQNWNGSTAAAAASGYWQNNYYQTDYFNSNPYPSYYGSSGTNALSISDAKAPVNSNQLNPPPLPATVNLTQSTVKISDNKTSENNGGLLADVIQKEQQEKEKEDIADSIVLKNSSRDDGIPYDWAVDLMKDYVPDLLENSPKMQLFFCILEESIMMDDRILVFSQSLLTLNHIERFLHRAKIPNTDTFWAKNQSYFRLDGSTTALEREKLINEFNANTNLKLFLVSTRAGSLGINLVGANRVIVFDASWNPCHDTQAVCRVYRYGQSKSCFVYRLVVDNCLEKKIYDRQINKQGMADRVIDECNPDAHLSMKEVTSLCYDDGEDPEIADFSDKKDDFEDLVVQKMLCKFSKALTKEPFHHESLLVDRKEKKLSQAEKRLAQRGYEMEKQAATKPTYNYNASGTQNYRLFRTTDGTLIQRPITSNVSVY
jgi:RAD54-like protein 2